MEEHFVHCVLKFVCIGGLCANEHLEEQTMCGTCIQDGYFQLDGFCEKCPEIRRFLLNTLSLIVAAGVLFYFLKKVKSKININSVVMTMLSRTYSLTQKLYVVAENGVSFGIISTYMSYFSVAAGANFEAYIQDECVFAMGYELKYLIKLVIPFAIATLVALLSWIATIFIKCFSGNQKHLNAINKYSWMAFLYLAKYGVLPLSIIALGPFDTVEGSTENNNRVLDDAREVSVEDFTLSSYLIFFSFSAFYTVILPSVLTWVLYQTKKKNFPQKWVERISWLYDDYRPQFFYWEIVETVMRLLMALVNLFLTHREEYMLFLSFFLFLLEAILNLIASPAKFASINFFTAALASCISLILIGYQRVESMFVTFTLDILRGLLIITLFPIFIYSLIQTFKQWGKEQKESWIERKWNKGKKSEGQKVISLEDNQISGEITLEYVSVSDQGMI